MTTLNYMARERGFCREYVKSIHPDWPPERIESFWRNMNAPERVAKATPRQRQVLVCDDCGATFRPERINTKRRRFCDACLDEHDRTRNQAYNAGRRTITNALRQDRRNARKTTP